MNLETLFASLRHLRWPLVVILVALSGALLWLATRSQQIDSIVVGSAPLVRSVQFSARVATLTRVDIGSTITGRVAQVLVREGAQVRQGDELVRLESDELQAALVQARASQTQAQARLDGLRTTGRAQAQAALAQAQATVLAAQADMTRTQQLVKQGFLSPSRLDESQRAVQVALAGQDSAAAQVRANNDAGTDLAQAQAQLALAQAVTQAAQARLTQTVLRAPTDARVLSRSVEPGQIVQAGRALLSLALAGPTQLKAQVDERFLAQLAPNQPATVVADAFADQRLAAHVLSIAPAVDAQRGAVEVTLELDQPAPPYLREDMTLSVEVETARRAQALVLPLSALHGAPDASANQADVLVAVDGRAQLRHVQLGVRTLEAAEILDGLKAGDEVLVGAGVQAGQRVRAHVLPANTIVPGSAAGGNQAGTAGAALTNAMGR